MLYAVLSFGQTEKVLNSLTTSSLPNSALVIKAPNQRILLIKGPGAVPKYQVSVFCQPRELFIQNHHILPTGMRGNPLF